MWRVFEPCFPSELFSSMMHLVSPCSWMQRNTLSITQLIEISVSPTKAFVQLALNQLYLIVKCITKMLNTNRYLWEDENTRQVYEKDILTH